MLLLQSNISQLFTEGGYFPMTIISLLLVTLFIAVWKVPTRVKEIGHLALAVGLLWIPVTLIQTSDVMQVTGDASLSFIWFGIKCSMIPFAYSLVVYIISLILRIALKPRK